MALKGRLIGIDHGLARIGMAVSDRAGLTARELHSLGLIDKVLPEPRGGAHRSPESAAQVLSEEISAFLTACHANRWNIKDRQRKYRSMGVWIEKALEAPGPVETAIPSTAGL